MILEIDGQNVELYEFIIRTEEGRFVSGHSHNPGLIVLPTSGPIPEYVVASIAPVGLSTFYTRRPFDGTRVLSYSGHTVVMSEAGRKKKIRETGSLPFHGTPDILKERFLLLFSFKMSE